MVESIFAQGEHVVECGVEGEVVTQVVVRGGGGTGRIDGGSDIRGGNGKCSGACWGRGFGGRALEGPSRGSSEQGGPEHTFFAAPSPLLLLLFRFVVVSMGVSSASGVVGAGLVLVFFLVLDAGGC